MQLWTPNEPADAPDLTPMIDVVFLLIVFFMTEASMIAAEKHPVAMPVALHSRVAKDPAGRLTITITRRVHCMRALTRPAWLNCPHYCVVSRRANQT